MPAEECDTGARTECGGGPFGGILIGLATSLMTLYVPAASEVVIYVLMAIVLTIRPRGLFGEEGLFG